MSGEFSFFMSGAIIMFFILALMLLITPLMYFIDDYFVSAKNAVISACVGILVLIVDTVICYWVWG